MSILDSLQNLNGILYIQIPSMSKFSEVHQILHKFGIYKINKQHKIQL